MKRGIIGGCQRGIVEKQSFEEDQELIIRVRKFIHSFSSLSIGYESSSVKKIVVGRMFCFRFICNSISVEVGKRKAKNLARRGGKLPLLEEIPNLASRQCS